MVISACIWRKLCADKISVTTPSLSFMRKIGLNFTGLLTKNQIPFSNKIEVEGQPNSLRDGRNGKPIYFWFFLCWRAFD